MVKANPELLDYANYNVKALYNILSENMKPEYWVKAGEEIANDISEGADGVVIAHGTDTMHYTSAALSFMLKTPVPIIITGAQRSSDRPSSDANINLIDSVIAAKSDIADGVFRLMDAVNVDIKDGNVTYNSTSFEEARDIKARIIQWVPVEENVKVTIVMDDASLKTGLGESALCDLEVGDVVQFERVGFARLDEIRDDELVFYYAHK